MKEYKKSTAININAILSIILGHKYTCVWKIISTGYNILATVIVSIQLAVSTQYTCVTYRAGVGLCNIQGVAILKYNII